MYLSFYNLQREPFLLTPDTGFIHLSSSHRESLIAILNGVVNSKGFMVLTGGTGTGKTTVINAALKCLPRAFPVVSSALLVNPLLSATELIEAIVEDFGVPVSSDSKTRRLNALQEHLLEIQNKGGRSVLIVDEAHLLTPELLEEIRLLGNIETYSGKLIQIILSGQPELATTLLEPRLRAFRQRVSVMAQLRPLTESEIPAYISQRLRAAGLNGANPFSSLSIRQLFRSTHGIPRLINVLCQRCLEIGSEDGQLLIEAPTVDKAIRQLTAQTNDGIEFTDASSRDAGAEWSSFPVT